MRIVAPAAEDSRYRFTGVLSTIRLVISVQ